MTMMMINSETFIGVADILLLLSRFVAVITVMMMIMMIIVVVFIIIIVVIIIIIAVITATAAQRHQYLTVFSSAELRAEKESLDKIKPYSPCIYVRAQNIRMNIY
jgi:hypothetical protein